jgi:4-hydroxybenzoate polyprenyltransferase
MHEQPHEHRPSAPVAIRALAVVHPAPSAIVALLVASLALVAGAEPSVAGWLAVGMLGYQFSIGALNDLADADSDALAGRDKPIAGGLISKRSAAAIVIVGGAIGMGISATFGAAVLILGGAGYATGVAYDVGMRRLGLGWLCFAAAFPLLLAWTWMAAAATLPPGWPFLLPLAALAGPTIHLANSMVDPDTDLRSGTTTLATQLGPARSRRTLAASNAIIYVLAWVTLASMEELPGLAAASAVAATVTAAAGIGLSLQRSRRWREAGWLLQAIGLAMLALAWMAAVVST